MTELRKSSNLTPRQRCAISNPTLDSTEDPHARHHKRSGNVQSILTFEVAELDSLKDEPDDEIPDDVLARGINGWFAVWHGRVATHPVSHVDKWDSITTARAEGVLKRVVESVGLEDSIEVHNGADLKSIHVYKWATHDELRLAQAELGTLDGEKEKTDE